MSDREEWGPWVEHDGKGRPVSVGLLAQWVIEKSDGRARIVAGAGRTVEEWGKFATVTGQIYDGLGWEWDNFGKRHPITGRLIPKVIRYRIRKPRALIQLREMIETLPAPRQKEDA